MLDLENWLNGTAAGCYPAEAPTVPWGFKSLVLRSAA